MPSTAWSSILGTSLDTLATVQSLVASLEPLRHIWRKQDPKESLRLCEEIRQLEPQTAGNDECISRNRALVAAGSSCCGPPQMPSY